MILVSIRTHHIIEQNTFLQSMNMFCKRFFKGTVVMEFIVFYCIISSYDRKQKKMYLKSHIAEFNHDYCLSIINYHNIGAFKVIKTISLPPQPPHFTRYISSM